MPLSQDAMTVARNGTFQDRIRYHLTKAAVDAMAEAAITTGHTLRVAYAGKVLDGTADFAGATIGVLTNTTIAAAITPTAADFGIADTDLPFVVNSLFNALAGVSL